MKLVILEPLGVEEEKLLALAEEKLGNRAEIVYYDTRVTDPDTLAGRAEDADIAVISNLPFKKEVMERCPKLKMLSVAFTGVDHVDMDYCRERGILVSNCAGYSNTAVSELVFGLALSLYRRIIECDRAVRAGKDKTGLVGLELSGKKFGIIGMGAIGTRTAQLAKAFGCEIDSDALYETRESVADQINEILLHRLRSNIRFCAACGKPLPLHYHSRLCKDCWRKREK